jgi:hypothetical protein
MVDLLLRQKDGEVSMLEDQLPPLVLDQRSMCLQRHQHFHPLKEVMVDLLLVQVLLRVGNGKTKRQSYFINDFTVLTGVQPIISIEAAKEVDRSKIASIAHKGRAKRRGRCTSTFPE